jgi:hypothetical protein
MKETVYIEPPKFFGSKSGKDIVILFLKSLYGLKQVPKTFYEKLSYGLLERGFKKSEIDPFLFMKKGCICVGNVDNTIFAGPKSALFVKLLPLPQPHLRARTDARTNPNAQSATQLRSVLARVYAVSRQNQINTTVP